MAPQPPPRQGAADPVVGSDPVTGEPVRQSQVYAEVDGKVFVSRQTQLMYYEALKTGMCYTVDPASGLPKLTPLPMTMIWQLKVNKEIGARLTSYSTLSPDQTTASQLPSGHYEFLAKAPELEPVFVMASRREIKVTLQVLSIADNGNILDPFTIVLSPDNKEAKVTFAVPENRAPAAARMKFEVNSMVHALFVQCSISRRPLKVEVGGAQEARRKSQSLVRPGEFIVEMTQDAAGYGMALGWDKTRDCTIITEIVPQGVADRTKKVRVGDEICAVHGTRVDGLRFAEVKRLLQNVPMTVVLVAKSAPVGWSIEARNAAASAPKPVPPPRQNLGGPQQQPQQPLDKKSSSATSAPRPRTSDSSGPPPPRPPRREDSSSAAQAAPVQPQTRLAPPPPVAARDAPPPPMRTAPPPPGTAARPQRPPTRPADAAAMPPPLPAPVRSAALPPVAVASVAAAASVVAAAPEAPPARQSRPAPPASIPAARPAPPVPVPAAAAAAAAPAVPPARPTTRPPPPATRPAAPVPSLAAAAAATAAASQQAPEPQRAPRSPRPAAPVAPTAPVSAPAPSAPPVVASPAPAPAVTSDYGPEMERYVRMRRSGLPDGAIANAMARDGVTPPPGFLPDSVQPLTAAKIVISHNTNRPAPAAAAAAAAPAAPNLVDSLAGFDKSKLRKSTDRTPEEKKAIAEKGQTAFAGLAAAITARRDFIQQDSDDEADGDDDEWRM